MKLSIVILNWNGKLLLKKFLPNIILYTPNTPIYVVDNSSDDGSLEFLKKEHKSLTVIKLSRNTGYAKAYNYALKKIDSDVYCLINNLLSIDLYTFATASKSVFVVCSLILWIDSFQFLLYLLGGIIVIYTILTSSNFQGFELLYTASCTIVLPGNPYES